MLLIVNDSTTVTIKYMLRTAVDETLTATFPNDPLCDGDNDMTADPTDLPVTVADPLLVCTTAVELLRSCPNRVTSAENNVLPSYVNVATILTFVDW